MREVRAGAQVEAETETTEDRSLLVCSLAHADEIFSYIPEPWVALLIVGWAFPHQIAIKISLANLIETVRI